MARKSTKTFTAEPFGKIKFDRDTDELVAKVTHGDQRIDIRFGAESKEELDHLLPTAMKFWRSRSRWFKEFREYAVDELLDTLNDFLDCGEDDPPEVTASQLRKLLKVPFMIEFRQEDEDEDVCFILSGGDSKALGEHCFEATGTLDDGFVDGDVVSLL